MALKPVFLLLLWELTLFVHGVTSLCNVTCSTDYSVSLNCSCSGFVPTHSVLLHVKCSDEDFDVNGSCEVKPPQSWCVMYPDMLDLVASIGTTCTATVGRQGDQVIMNDSESSSWYLADVVKPPPPINVQVTYTDGSYNITWDHNDRKDCLTYRVRVRESKDLSKDPAYPPLVEKKHNLLDPVRLRLQPHVTYTVDVQAKMCPGYHYKGPWSEWSSTAEWRSAEIEGINGYWWCLSFLSFFILVAVLVTVLLSQKPYWKKKLQLVTYIPKPDEFFKPLYHNYGGNFKVRESKNKLSSLGFVCNFQIGPAGVALEGTFSTSGPRLVGLSLEFTFKGLHDLNDSVCRGFKRLFVFRLSDTLWVDICV